MKTKKVANTLQNCICVRFITANLKNCLYECHHKVWTDGGKIYFVTSLKHIYQDKWKVPILREADHLQFI